MIETMNINYISHDGVRWALRQSLIHDIRPGLDRLLLVVLAIHADRDGYLRPSQERLAKLTGANLRSIERGISAFKARGLLRVLPEQRGRIRINHYHLCEWNRLSATGSDPQPKIDPDDPALATQPGLARRLPSRVDGPVSATPRPGVSHMTTRPPSRVKTSQKIHKKTMKIPGKTPPGNLVVVVVVVVPKAARVGPRFRHHDHNNNTLWLRKVRPSQRRPRRRTPCQQVRTGHLTMGQRRPRPSPTPSWRRR